MKRFKNNSMSLEVAAAARKAETLLAAESKMLGELRNKDDFEYGAGMGVDVYWKIVNCVKTVGIFTYRPKWCFTKAIAYFDGENIHINIYKLRTLSHKDLVGLLCHEWLHAAGFNHGTGRFKNYKTKHKVKHSVNYFVSENIGRWL